MTSYDYIIMIMVDSYMILFHHLIVSCSWRNHIILLLMFVTEKSATNFGDLPDW